MRNDDKRSRCLLCDGAMEDTAGRPNACGLGRCPRLTIAATLPPAAPIQAHSKSEYKRLDAQGANVVPPAASGELLAGANALGMIRIQELERELAEERQCAVDREQHIKKLYEQRAEERAKQSATLAPIQTLEQAILVIEEYQKARAASAEWTAESAANEARYRLSRIIEAMWVYESRKNAPADGGGQT